MSAMDDLKDLLVEKFDIAQMNEGTSLLGSIPELDSMAIVELVTDIEERFDVVFDDDELEAEAFETVGSLLALIVDKKQNQ